MNVNFKSVQAIMDTLPISLYADRAIPCKLSETHDTSYYDVAEDTITISYPQISEGLKNIDEEKYESICRSLLYHEISHALLTPQTLVTDVFNIFEDERIETLLKDFYYGIDFVGTLFAMCKDTVDEEPKTALQKFFKIVRLRQGTEEENQKVDDLINKYDFINKTSDSYKVAQYKRDIDNLFYDLCKEFPKEEKDKATSSHGKTTLSKSGEEKGGEGGEGKSGKSGGEDSGNKSKSGGEGESEKSKETAASAGAARKTARLAMGKGKMSDTKGKGENPIGIRTFKGICAMGATKDYKKKFYDTIQLLFNSYKKRTNSGGTAQSYSGVFNPRNTLRTDYKLFDRALNTRTGGHFGQFNLNLFLDCSGSFSPNVMEMNRILTVIKDLKHRNPNFTYSITVCGEGEKIIEDTDSFVFNAYGGNDLDDDIFDIYRRLQKPNYNNYNIVLFDGDAFSDDYGNYHTKNFKAFDFSNTTIISDVDNERYINKTVTTARVIYSSDYCRELEKNITKALQIGLN